MIFVIKICAFLLNIIYFFFKLLPSKNKITMLSRQSNVPSNEFLMIEEQIKKTDGKVIVVKLCKTLDGGVNSSTVNKIKYAFHMLTQMYNMATSKVVILDSYCIAASMLKHKESLTIIQIWHSMGTMKKFGYTALDTEEGTKSKLAYAMKMHENYDYVFASADSYKEHLAKGFNIDIDKIVTMPLPRLDLLKSNQYREKIREDIFSLYPELKNKPVILYCPTFRKNEEDFQTALDKLAECVDMSEYNFVVKLHPLSKTVVKDQIIQAKEFSTFDLLFASDYVISDYSCVIYEAAVLGLPLYFYNFDMNIYLEGRGLAIDYYKELPGIISEDPRKIMAAIKAREYDFEKLLKFKEKYIKDTENATRDIVNFILKFIK